MGDEGEECFAKWAVLNENTQSRRPQYVDESIYSELSLSPWYIIPIADSTARLFMVSLTLVVCLRVLDHALVNSPLSKMVNIYEWGGQGGGRAEYKWEKKKRVK